LRYLEFTPHYADRSTTRTASAPGPGLTRDGRVSTLADQARIPLLASNEMANTSPAAVVRAIRASDYASLFEQTFGAAIWQQPATAFGKALDALQAFQLEDDSFHPYSSRYDLYASNKIGGKLTAQELRGFQVCQSEQRNCFACHFNGAGIGSGVGCSPLHMRRHQRASCLEIPANRDPMLRLGIYSQPDHPLPANARLRDVGRRRSKPHPARLHNSRFTTLRASFTPRATRTRAP
jgi:cytochrome c peroxidase